MKYIIIAIAALVTAWLLFSSRHEPVGQPGVPENQQLYYEQVFNYTMDNIEPGNRFDWKTYNAAGNIAVSGLFVSKSGYTCRGFAESYTVSGVPRSDTGYACKRVDRNGWCKLSMKDILTCALENPAYHINLPGMPSVPDTPDASVDSDVPDIETGSGSNVNVASPTTNGRGKPSASDAANTVTHSAGSAAGYIAKNAGGWFSSLFR